MSSSPDLSRSPKRTRVPPSFFYDRVVPVLLAAMGIVFMVVVVVVIGALVGIIPIQ